MDNKTKIMLFFPVILAIILAIAANYIDIPFNNGIPASAGTIAAFTPSDLTIKEKQTVHSTPDFRAPLDFNRSVAAEASLPVNNPAPEQKPKEEPDKSLSLIIMSGADRTAIINGVPVKEGDRIADMRIVRIETDRVLLKTKTLKWIYLE
ncbi:MAG: hypothetical protein C4581_11555 [Nitrospiraceae bacterium]|nr:MAG: hypothetical protein C4581_11555 [Nitrospiraceae bacterium]